MLVSSEGLELRSMETWRRRSDDVMDSVEEESHADEAEAVPGERRRKEGGGEGGSEVSESLGSLAGRCTS